MRQADLFLLFTEPLERFHIRYMVGGSVASMSYGEPRLTNDIDIVVDLNPVAVKVFCKAYPEEQFYCPPEEVVRVECKRSRRGHFNVIHHETGHKADFYMRGEDPLQDWALARRIKTPISSDAYIWLAPPEYVIVRKLEYYREGGSQKHVEDIQGMLQASEDMIDFTEVDSWVEKLGLEEHWSRCRLD
jgi:hypothetical protein